MLPFALTVMLAVFCAAGAALYVSSAGSASIGEQLAESCRSTTGLTLPVLRDSSDAEAIVAGLGASLPFVDVPRSGATASTELIDEQGTPRRLREAEALRELCSRYKTRLIINDDAELAARLGVGVHLGQTDGPLTPARALLGRNAIIGSTCHSQIELAEQAAREGASYVAFGRFFNSSTKPGAPAATLEMLAQARARLQVPICVIGGISLENAAPLVEHGADLLAVVHGLFGADSPQEVTRRARAFNELLKS